jgi:hypothetical protein
MLTTPVTKLVRSLGELWEYYLVCARACCGDCFPKLLLLLLLLLLLPLRMAAGGEVELWLTMCDRL